MNILYKLTILLTVMLIPVISSYGQAAQFKAMYLYKFAKGVSWPNADAARAGDFVISIVGDSEMASAIKKTLASRKIGSRNIVVYEISSVALLQNSDVVFLGESKSEQIHRLVESVKDKHVLIVSGKSGWCEHGAAISFINKGGALTYEVSQKKLQEHGLTCSQELMRSGVLID